MHVYTYKIDFKSLRADKLKKKLYAIQDELSSVKNCQKFYLKVKAMSHKLSLIKPISFRSIFISMQNLCRCGFKTCILYHSTVGLKVVVLFTNTRKN